MTSIALLIVILAQTPQTPQPAPAQAAPPPAGRFSGLVFGDYYFFPREHVPAWQDQHGFWIRRAYFTYDHTFSPKVTARLRFEMNSNGKLAGGALTPFVKDAYVKWTYHGRQSVTAGIQPTITLEHADNVWGLRHIEKMPLDLYRLDSSRDAGFTLAGPIDASQTWKYAVQYGNDAGSNAETDTFKGYRAALRYEVNPGFTVEGALAHFDRDKQADRRTAQIFAAYRAKRGRAGAEYLVQTRSAADGSAADDIALHIASGFAVFDIKPRVTSAFARVDRVNDACPDCPGIDYLPIDGGGPFTVTIAGLEYFLLPAVRVSPNIEWVKYDARAGATATPKDDIAARVTFYWIW